jgi:hypothetical protein
MQKCYVYCHKRKDNGEIFYIGRGTGNRLRFRCARSKDWGSTVDNAGGFMYEILWDQLSISEAKKIEMMYIDLLGDTLVNKLKRHSDPLINFKFEELSEYFKYDEDSPSGLVWKKDYHGKKAGQVAGYLTAGYFILRFAGEKIRVSRLVYFLTKCQDLTDKVVDHLDGNTTNNKIDNLRLCSQKQNCRNRVTKARNTTGYIGVYVTYKGSYKYLTASALGELKNFSLIKLEYQEALAQAVSWRDEKLKSLPPEDSFTERHLKGPKC